ncbi:MAG: helix-turn-helix domain containing protein [Firmicutes bacterium]|nr:helix-turn-helix domain containing protein [Bacillota bacterium]
MDIRTKILTAGRDMACERGFRGLTMDGLAAQAGVSKRTVYRYFSSKEALIDAALEDFMRQVAGEVARIMREETEPIQVMTALQAYLVMHGRFIINPLSLKDLKEYYPHLWQKIDHFRLAQVGALLALISSNAPPPDLTAVDSRIAAAVILTSIQTVLNPDFLLANQLTFEAAALQLSRFLMNGYLPR